VFADGFIAKLPGSKSVYIKSEIAFGFCKLLGFELMPRLKNIYEQKLYLVDKTDEEQYPHLRLILERAINWELIRQQYDQMVKYATALRLGTAETEAILRWDTANRAQASHLSGLFRVRQSGQDHLFVSLLTIRGTETRDS